MSPLYFPLRWESTGEQWWYASPIDCAAASGHYELVKELLCIDTNLLIKLTSLRRIRRLETVWDDEDKFNDVAKCRAYVAKKLVLECETKCGSNSLIRAGYGGWLLYTAASAGDMGFVQDLLERDPLLVFGEGEYGITDILYASARSNNSEVFLVLFNSAVGLRRSFNGDVEKEGDEFMVEMMNRAVHCAVRGGNLVVLKYLLVDCCDVLVYTDALGSTILHSAAAKGQVEVMKHLIASYEIVESTDDQGNTALHIAAYNGFLAAVEALLAASSSLAVMTNKQGYTFLHMAVAGFQVPGFHRIDQHLDLMKQLVSSTNIIYIQDVINERNNQGRTALHLAVCDNIQANLVELLMMIPCIDLNITDVNGMTALDILKQHPESASSKLLFKQMIAAGASVSCRKDRKLASAESKLKFSNSIGSVPGTSFKVADSEIFLYVQNEDDSNTASSCSSQGYSGELSMKSSGGSKNSASTVLKQLLQLPKKNDKSLQGSVSSNETPTPLRHRFSRGCSLPNNKRVIPIRCEIPSSSAKKNFTASLMQGVVIQQPMPKSVISLANSPSTPFSRSSISSPSFSGGKSTSFRHDKSPSKEKLMNHYFCFGAQGLAVENLVSYETTQHFQNKCVVNL